jgi:hypothetical protein
VYKMDERIGDIKIAPFLTYEEIILRQVEKCNEAHTSQSNDFFEAVRTLELNTIPLLSSEEFKKQREKICTATNEIEDRYEGLMDLEFESEKATDGMYKDRWNLSKRTLMQQKYASVIQNEIAEKAYAILLDNGRIRGTFRSRRGSETFKKPQKGGK